MSMSCKSAKFDTHHTVLDVFSCSFCMCLKGAAEAYVLGQICAIVAGINEAGLRSRHYVQSILGIADSPIWLICRSWPLGFPYVSICFHFVPTLSIISACLYVPVVQGIPGLIWIHFIMFPQHHIFLHFSPTQAMSEASIDGVDHDVYRSECQQFPGLRQSSSHPQRWPSKNSRTG